jgi:hypothetical protein
MTETPDEPRRAYSRENSKYWEGVEADDIPQGWMDHMVKRLFDVLNRDLIRLETDQRRDSDQNRPDGKPPEVNIERVAKRQRMAKDMQHSLERLRSMEMERPKSKKKLTDEQAFAELERRVDQLVAERGSAKDSGGTDS